MLVHFPIALWLTGVLAFLIGYLAVGDVFWYRVAAVGFVAGSVFAVIAAIPGTIDLFGAIKPGTVERVTGVKHMALNLLAVVVFTCVGIMMLYSYDRHMTNAINALDVTLPLVLSIAGALIVVISGTLGSKLVHKEHVGQNISEYPLPRTR